MKTTQGTQRLGGFQTVIQNAEISVSDSMLESVTYGSRCKFEHKCGICGKYGHGAHNCRRSFDKDYSEKPGKYDRDHDKRDDHKRGGRQGTVAHGVGTNGLKT